MKSGYRFCCVKSPTGRSLFPSVIGDPFVLPVGGVGCFAIWSTAGGRRDDCWGFVGPLAVWCDFSGVAGGFVSLGSVAAGAGYAELFVSCVAVGVGVVHVCGRDGVSRGYHPEAVGQFLGGFSGWDGGAVCVGGRVGVVLASEHRTILGADIGV